MKNTTRQKTWTDLLGVPQGNEQTDGNTIVRMDGDHGIILWRFETVEAAASALKTWQSGHLCG